MAEEFDAVPRPSGQSCDCRTLTSELIEGMEMGNVGALNLDLLTLS